MIKNIVFDLGNVLFEFKKDNFVKKYNNGVLDEKIKHAFFSRWEEMDAGTLSSKEYLEYISPSLKKEEYDLTKHFLKTWMFNLDYFDDMIDFLHSVKKQGYNVYAISNISQDFADNQAKIPILAEFIDIVYSAPIKMMKPDKEIFVYAVNKFNIDPKKSLYIDDYMANVESAESVGFNGFCYSRNTNELKEFLNSLNK